MSDISPEARNSVSNQQRMFSLARDHYGLNRAKLSVLTDISTSTLKGWETGTVMPAWAIGELAKAGVPADLLSLVFDPFNCHFGVNGDGGDNLDEVAAIASDLAHAYNIARNPNSPGGIQIVPQEEAGLRPIKRRLHAASRKAAA